MCTSVFIIVAVVDYLTDSVCADNKHVTDKYFIYSRLNISSALRDLKLLRWEISL